MKRWIEPAKLSELVQRDIKIRGVEAPEQVILREPSRLISVTEPGIPPLDVPTYEVRRARWHQGEGPTLVGIDQFMTVLTSLTEPACAVTVQGTRTSYVLLLDAALSRVLAGLAIDPPSGNTTMQSSDSTGVS